MVSTVSVSFYSITNPSKSWLFKSTIMYLTHNVVNQNLGQAQLGCSSSLGWAHSCIWSQLKGCLQTVWPASWGDLSVLYRYFHSCMQGSKRASGKCKVSWGLGMKIEQHNFCCILLTKLSYKTSPNSVTSYGYREENNYGQFCKQSTMIPISCIKSLPAWNIWRVSFPKSPLTDRTSVSISEGNQKAEAAIEIWIKHTCEIKD